MTSQFKRKSTSLPQIRKQIYSKISKDFGKQKWKIFIQNQISLSQIIYELSKAQFDISNQTQMKYSVRQNILIKKQIIKKLSTQQIEEGLNKLRQLADKIPCPHEAKHIKMMIVFLEGKEVLQQSIQNNNQEYAIQWFKNSMSQFIIGNQVDFIKIKILTLLSILLLKFHGVLMILQQNKILYKTIELKRKKLILIQSHQEKQSEFECLLYILSEFYKILFLIKKDQQIITFYYNQLAAYTQAYAQRENQTINLDLKQISRILKTMRPVLYGLNIYQDCKFRTQCLFANIQTQIAENQPLKSHNMPSDNKPQTNPKFLNYRTSTKHRPRAISIVMQSKKLVIQNSSKQLQLPEIKEDDTAALEAIQKQGMILSFLMTVNQKLYLLELKIIPRNSFTLINILLSIKDQKARSQIYRLIGIQTLIESLTVAQLSKFIQKLIRTVFSADPRFEQLHNLQIIQSYLPDQLNLQHIVPALIRSKTFISAYLRNHYTQQFAVGNKFIMPKCTLSQIKNSLLSQIKDKQMRKEKGLFIKRKGKIQNEIKFTTDSLKQLNICFLFKNQTPLHQNFYCFSLYYDLCFKGIDVYCFEDDQQTPDLTNYIPKFKQVTQTQKHINKQTVIQSIIMLQSPTQTIINKIQQYNIEEELQSYISIPTVRTLQLKGCSKLQKTFKRVKKDRLKQYEVVKTVGQQYYLFVKQTHHFYQVYYNLKAKIYLTLNWRSIGWKLQLKRLRMYAAIKIVFFKNSNKHFVKVSKRNESLVIQQQQIALKLTKHYILTKKVGYCIVQEYQSQTGQLVYQVIVDTRHRYFCITFNKIRNIKHSLNLAELTLSGSKLHLYTMDRKAISEANHYFLQTRKANFRV